MVKIFVKVLFSIKIYIICLMLKNVIIVISDIINMFLNCCFLSVDNCVYNNNFIYVFYIVFYYELY